MPLLPFSDASPPTTNASLLTSGTLADARLSANVPLLNSASDQTFTNGLISGTGSVVAGGNQVYVNSNGKSAGLYNYDASSWFWSADYNGNMDVSNNLTVSNTLSVNGKTPAYLSVGNSFAAGQTITAPANTSALTASYSVTGANTTALVNLTGTWNTSGIVTGLKLNITDTASAATSLLMDLQVGGTSKAYIDKTGASFTAGQTITAPANTSALTASYSVTGANTTPLLNLTGTWNTTGVATGLKLNITDTASNASSLLMDLQVGGTSRLSLTKAAVLTLSPPNSSSIGGTQNAVGTGFFFRGDYFPHISTAGSIAYHIGPANNSQFLNGIGFASSLTVGSTTADTYLTRDAANTLALRNGTNAQTSRIYGTFTDASNGRRLDITSTTGGVFTLTATGNGTGATGNLLKLTAPILLPSSSVTLATNGDLAFEATSNTTLTIRYRGSDGTTRSATIALI